ncbi:hypothetical protein P5673_021076 [Acropora cervicornis]|uniref:Uncharacterized protein n=1 Tax=Acropora cervicornis TaxID=6130 RepID=A0AAD9V0J8_ACRCE|nr:hypothetical protein P5673_021076 [Acropora cervicornis]
MYACGLMQKMLNKEAMSQRNKNNFLTTEDTLVALKVANSRVQCRQSNKEVAGCNTTKSNCQGSIRRGRSESCSFFSKEKSHPPPSWITRGLTENFTEVQFQKKWSQIWLSLKTDRQLKSDISNGVSLKRHSNYYSYNFRSLCVQRSCHF